MADKKEYTGKTDLLYLLTLIKSEFDKYVKIIDGKGLSTNDFTDALKQKLAEIEAGAEVNVQSDWNQTDTTKDDYIKNKPTSMPASDVYDWAKAATKPTYSADDINWAAPKASPTFTGIPKAPDYNNNTTSSQLVTVNYLAIELAKKVGIKFQKVDSYADLPAHGTDGVIYLVPKTGASNPDIYTEYYWVPDEETRVYYCVNDGMQPSGSEAPYSASLTDINKVLNGELESIFLGNYYGWRRWVVYYQGEEAIKIASDDAGTENVDYVKKSQMYSWGTTGRNDYPKRKEEAGTPGFYDILGDTSVDLSDYVKSEDITEITETEVKAIWDGVFGS